MYVVLGVSHVVIITELITGRVMKTIEFPAVIQEVRWNPSANYSDVIAVVCETSVYFLDLDLSGNEEIHSKCQDLLHSRRKEHEREDVRGIQWLVNDGSETFVDESNILVLRHTNPVKDICWHRGFACV